MYSSVQTGRHLPQHRSHAKGKIANALKKFDYACWKCPLFVDLASQKNSFAFPIFPKWATAFSAFDFGRSLAVFYIFSAAGAEITSSVTAG